MTDRPLGHALLAALFLVVLTPESLLACSVCFGPEEGGLSAGLNAGIAILLALVLLMQLLIVRFFVRVMRRARSTKDARPSSEVPT